MVLIFYWPNVISHESFYFFPTLMYQVLILSAAIVLSMLILDDEWGDGWALHTHSGEMLLWHLGGSSCTWMPERSRIPAEFNEDDTCT